MWVRRLTPPWPAWCAPSPLRSDPFVPHEVGEGGPTAGRCGVAGKDPKGPGKAEVSGWAALGLVVDAGGREPQPEGFGAHQPGDHAHPDLRYLGEVDLAL